ncbi:YggT family protein [Candidatus Roizmanbacteria bacterium]|nr:YggT family protein [Candidatus Roizmanbacteria bacterium]
MAQKIVQTKVSQSEPQEIVRTTHTVQQGTTSGEYKKKKFIFRAYQLIWYVLGVVEVLLFFRILLKALGANPASGFTNLVYVLSDPLAQPFAGIFRVSIADEAVFEWSTFIAMLVYFLIAYGIIYLFQLIKPADPIEVEEEVDNV